MVRFWRGKYKRIFMLEMQIAGFLFEISYLGVNDIS